MMTRKWFEEILKKANYCITEYDTIDYEFILDIITQDLIVRAYAALDKDEVKDFSKYLRQISIILEEAKAV